jgi:hypothetical protein
MVTRFILLFSTIGSMDLKLIDDTVNEDKGDARWTYNMSRYTTYRVAFSSIISYVHHTLDGLRGGAPHNFLHSRCTVPRQSAVIANIFRASALDGTARTPILVTRLHSRRRRLTMRWYLKISGLSRRKMTHILARALAALIRRSRVTKIVN